MKYTKIYPKKTGWSSWNCGFSNQKIDFLAHFHSKTIFWLNFLFLAALPFPFTNPFSPHGTFWELQLAFQSSWISVPVFLSSLAQPYIISLEGFHYIVAGSFKVYAAEYEASQCRASGHAFMLLYWLNRSLDHPCSQDSVSTMSDWKNSY